MKQQTEKRRVALTLNPEVMKRALAEQAKIARTAGIEPALAAVLAAAVERGLPK